VPAGEFAMEGSLTCRSPDLVPSDCRLLQGLKQNLGGRKFKDDRRV